MVIQWINQYRLWIWGVHELCWLMVSLYLSFLIKQEYDSRVMYQHMHAALMKQVSELKRNARVLQAASATSLNPVLTPSPLHNQLLNVRDDARRAGVVIRSLRIQPAPVMSHQAMLVSVEAEAKYASFLLWLKCMKQEKRPVFLHRLDVSVDRALIFSVEFIVDSTMMNSSVDSTVFFRSDIPIYDPFCLHEHSRIARAYRHDEHWKRYIDLSEMIFKTKYLRNQHEVGLFSWRGSLFWLDRGGALANKGMRLQNVFHDHADFISPDGKRISIFRKGGLA